MRISDWSSDVCSSDLRQGETPQILMDWLVAGIWTGLRPAEWRSTDLEMREDPPAPFGRRAWLYVINAKATHGRGNGMIRSEERRVGKACVSPCRSRWSPSH